jgi:hypothetical protein
MKVSEALEEAKRYLAKQGDPRAAGKTPYICVALYRTGKLDPLNLWVYTEAEYLVMENIRPDHTLVDHLSKRGELPSSITMTETQFGFKYDLTDENYTKIRDQWLDALIAKLKEEGR